MASDHISGDSGSLPSWPASWRARACTRVHPLGRVALEGQQRGGQRGEQPELKPGGAGPGGRSSDNAAPARGDRFGVGVQPLGGLRRPLVPADGLGGRAGLLVVRRDRAAAAFSPPSRARATARCLAPARRASAA